MRLLQVDENGEISLTDNLINNIRPYAILSHTWGEDYEEVNFKDLTKGPRKTNAGYQKLRFCATQAACDCLQYFWVGTCYIDKTLDFLFLAIRDYYYALRYYIQWVDKSLRACRLAPFFQGNATQLNQL
jgi:hypothetical protein